MYDEWDLDHLGQLGLLVDNKLTKQGVAVWEVCQKKSNLWADLLHFFHYTLWHENKSEENGFS